MFQQLGGGSICVLLGSRCRAGMYLSSTWRITFWPCFMTGLWTASITEHTWCMSPFYPKASAERAAHTAPQLRPLPPGVQPQCSREPHASVLISKLCTEFLQWSRLIPNLESSGFQFHLWSNLSSGKSQIGFVHFKDFFFSITKAWQVMHHLKLLGKKNASKASAWYCPSSSM